MDTQFVINGSTLDATADAIREMTGTIEEINPLDFPEEIRNIEPSTEEYMRLVDFMEYPQIPNENNYTETEVAKVDTLIEHFENLGGDADGE